MNTTPLAGLAAWVGALAGWRRYGLAALAGVLATLAFAPFYVVPALFVALPLLVWLIDTPASGYRAFVSAWWFGVGHFVTGLYWIGNAFGVIGGATALFAPAAVLLLAMLMALFIALACGVARRLRMGVIGFAVCWTLAEWLRGHVFTGFPWNLAGYVWAGTAPMLQTTAVVGIYGLSFVTLVLATAAAGLGRAPLGGRHGWTGVVLAGVLGVGLYVAGWARIPAAPAPTWPDLTLRLVQANIPQDDKWDEDLRGQHFARYMALSDEGKGRLDRTFIIWPETAINYLLEREPDRRALIGRLVNPDGYVLTGIPRVTFSPTGEPRIFNALEAIDGVGNIVASYDKHHLVPFGEYMPWRGLLSRLGLGKLTPGDVDFTPGPGPRTLALPGLPPFSPLICYEVIFPHAVVNRAHRPDWLLNVTNDGWYGISTGPHQHLAQALTRSVEEGLPLVRSAGTGISAIIDPYGRLTGMVPLGQAGVLNAPLPRPIDPPLYARWGDTLVFGLLALAILMGLAEQKARQKNARGKM